MNKGGNEELNKAFFQTKEARLWGAQLQFIPQNKLTISINYNHIGKEGRFLFPREWGREFLFTFQRRERNEGTGNAHAWTTQVSKTWSWTGSHKLKLNAGYGHYYRPSANDVTYNKYTLPANSQTNFGVLYHFGGILKGMRLEYLVAYKRLLDSTVSNPRFIINRVNMWNHNLVLNYQF